MIDDLHDLVGAYALDALPPEDVARFERHLEGCADCREEVTTLRGVADLLPLAATTVEPPAALRGRILESVAADAVGRRTASPALSPPRRASPQRSQRRSGWTRRPVSALALAAAVVIAGLGAWNIQLRHDLDNARSTSAFQQQIELQLASGARVSQISGSAADTSAAAALVQPLHGRGELIVDGLHANPTGRVFQVWLLQGSKPYSAGVFSYRQSGPAVISLALASTGYTAAAVTVEPGPDGSSAPTSSPVLVGKLRA